MLLHTFHVYSTFFFDDKVARAPPLMQSVLPPPPHGLMKSYPATDLINFPAILLPVHQVNVNLFQLMELRSGGFGSKNSVTHVRTYTVTIKISFLAVVLLDEILVVDEVVPICVYT